MRRVRACVAMLWCASAPPHIPPRPVALSYFAAGVTGVCMRSKTYIHPPYGLTALAPGGGACRALSRPPYSVALSVPSARPVHSLSPRYACPPHCGYPAHTGGLVGALSMRLRARAPGWATLSALRADGDGAALRGALGLRAPARGGVRLRYGACASRRAGVTVASAGAHAGVTGATLRGALVARFVLQLLRTIGVSLDSLCARRCRDLADGDHSGAQAQRGRAVGYTAYHRAQRCQGQAAPWARSLRADRCGEMPQAHI